MIELVSVAVIEAFAAAALGVTVTISVVFPASMGLSNCKSPIIWLYVADSSV